MSVTATELWRLGAAELAEAIRTRRASSLEAVEAHLRRIEAVNPRLNAVPVVLAEQGLEAARAADRAAAGGGELPPLYGVPLTVKANIDVLGTATSSGMKALAQSYPSRDAPAVERLKAAGAIVIGRTNLPDFGVGWHTDSELWGATVNPWDSSRTPGASSGGEGVAVATGMSPLGLGNDTLGSLRWPAQCSGVGALKPGLGRVPDATTVGPGELPIGAQLAGVQGPLARHAADLRLAYEVISGPSWRDPWSVPAPLRGPAPRRPIGVALVVDPAGEGTASQVAGAVRTAGAALADAGYAVEEVEPPSIAAAARALLDMLDLHGMVRLGAPPFRDHTKRWIEALLQVLGEPDPAATALSFMVRASVARAWGEFQESRPLIVAPIGSDLPFPVGSDRDAAGVARNLHDLRMAMAVNALGLPAVAVPVGVVEGLPQAVQVIGPRLREDLCLDAAEEMEARLGTFTPIDPREA